MARPRAFGAADEFLRYWCAAQEARYAQREGNTLFADSLLPTTGEVELVGEGIPLLPSGVQWTVDAPTAGTVTVTMYVAHGQALTARVTPPASPAGLQAVSVPVPLTPDATALRVTFPAGQDGIYTVSVRSAGTKLLTLLIPVTRAVFRALREDSRHLGYHFRRSTPPAPSASYRLRLALLIGAESAAQTGQATLAASLLADAHALPEAPTPTALHPFRRG